MNPVNNQRIPIWVADYVLMSYGTGSIMAVPGHDERDYEFAVKYKIDIVQVVSVPGQEMDDGAIEGDGVCINSDFLNKLETKKAKEEMISWLEKNKKGKKTINYRLRDWLISRQRYWGAPIPIVYDPEGKPHPIPEKHLPWLLPNDVEYKPKGTSPLDLQKNLLKEQRKFWLWMENLKSILWILLYVLLGIT